MSNYNLVKNLNNNPLLIDSFDNLAQETFGISFKDWFKVGGWDDNFILYSLIEDKKVIANVAVNKMNLVVNQQHYTAIQLGTIMTMVDKQNNGLATTLINHVINTYEDECDFIYLFANSTVLNFYPKFGFKQNPEYQYSFIPSQNEHKENIVKLDYSKTKDFNFINNYLKNKVLNSTNLACYNNDHLLKFYLSSVLKDNIYYLEKNDVIALYNHEDDIVNLFELISKKDINLSKVLDSIKTKATSLINIYFSVDCTMKNLTPNLIIDTDDYLFIRTKQDIDINKNMMPFTSHA